jgi:hypothetical protein
MPHEGAPESSMGPRSGTVPTCRLLAKQPLYIAAIKEAVGMDTVHGMFEMRCTHEIKYCPKPRMPRKGSVLALVWMFLLVGIGVTSIVVALNR